MATLGTLVGLATVLAVVASVFVGGLASRYDDGRDVIADAFPSGPRPQPSATATNVLLIGSDTRSDGGGRLTRRRRPVGHADARARARRPQRRVPHVDHARLVGRRPGHGQAKINAAYSWGGVPLTVQTVEQLLDVHIDHVAEIDFRGFAAMTDALGGVTVQSPAAFQAHGHHFAAGPNRLDGAAALAFVRERYSFADADHTRVRNQQAFMRGVLDGAVSTGTLTNPGRLQEFVTATSTHLSTDAGLDARAVAALGWSLRGLRPADLHTFTMPTAGSGTSPDGQSYVTLNGLEVQDLSRALRSDDVSGWLQDHSAEH